MRIHHPAVVARARRRNTDNLPFTAEVQLRGEDLEAPGGTIPGDYATAFSAPCRLAPSDVGASPNKHNDGDKPESQVRWFVFFDYQISVPPSARIIVTGKDGDNGAPWTKTLHVLAEMESRANRVSTKILCLERR